VRNLGPLVVQTRIAFKTEALNDEAFSDGRHLGGARRVLG
jgi:hypothetical protein